MNCECSAPDGTDSGLECTYPKCAFGEWEDSKQPDFKRPDAAPPKEIRGVFDPGSASDQVSPPSDAAQPVAWRWREYIRPGTVKSYWSGWRCQSTKPHSGGEIRPGIKVEIQPLYAHPENAPEGPRFNDVYALTIRITELEEALALATTSAPEGPYEISQQTDEMWIVRPKLVPKHYVKWRFEGTEAEAITVRDVLNRLKGDKTDG